jgi:hypothetical protein
MAALENRQPGVIAASTTALRHGDDGTPTLTREGDPVGSAQRKTGWSHGLPLQPRSQHVRCTSDSCRLCCIAQVGSPGPSADVRARLLICWFTSKKSRNELSVCMTSRIEDGNSETQGTTNLGTWMEQR